MMKTIETKNLYSKEVLLKLFNKAFGRKIFATDLSAGSDKMITTYWDERILAYLQHDVSDFVLETKYEDEKYTVKLQRADAKKTSWYATIETYRKGKLMCTDYVGRIFAYTNSFSNDAEECFYVASYGYEKYSFFRKAKTINIGEITTFTTSEYSDNKSEVTYIDVEEDNHLKFIDERHERRFNNGNLSVRESYSLDTFMRVLDTERTPSTLLIDTINDLSWELYCKDNPTRSPEYDCANA